ncbi:conserved hypothetical protein [Burkholderia diffusa]|uniref:hypothetical protein n=1 Tax=Burkholderia diffusa TaxID=488732 RepID=UPI001CB3818D|nr:hypothetical protein [Burkholderia diffusa]CAG9258400.1 conserved hypothetical protein [Burkholderia diffusa]
MMRKRKGRPGRTKEDLLPIQAPFIRNVALRAHLSVVNIRNGYGMRESLLYLQRILYITFLLMEPDRLECDDELFVEVELILDNAIQRENWRLSDSGLQAIEQVVTRFDNAIDTLPLHRVESAVGKLQQLVAKPPQLSPLRGSRLTELRL